MRAKVILQVSVTLVVVLCSILRAPIADAFFQGREVNNSGFVVAIRSVTSPVSLTSSSVCTGALYGNRIVVTAARCILASGGKPKHDLELFGVYAPDSDVSATKPVAKVMQYFAPIGNLKTLFPDIIFLVLDKKIGQSPIAELATYERARFISSMLSNTEVFGYGITSENTQAPYWNVVRKVNALLDLSKEPYENQSDYFRFTPAICEGDTGAPIISTLDGKMVLVGIAFSAQGFDFKCDGKATSFSGDGVSQSPKISFATIAGEYKQILGQAVALANELDARERAAEEQRAAEARAKAEAEARAKAEAEAKARAEKEVCDANRAQLLNVQASLLNALESYPKSATVLNNTRLRLESALSGSCIADVTLNDFQSEVITVISQAKKLSITKQTSITCVKGKVSKKVTAVKPKCPAGYKRK